MKKMIKCDNCTNTEESSWSRGGPSGLPDNWISIVAVNRNEEEQVDSVTAAYSGKFCSYLCMMQWLDKKAGYDLYKKHSIRPSGLDIKEEVVETREMQATRIGLAVLDVINVLIEGEEDVGALIPLSEEYEEFAHTCVLTVAKVLETDLPEAFQLKDPEVAYDF
jgi:hypothetical protein